MSQVECVRNIAKRVLAFLHEDVANVDDAVHNRNFQIALDQTEVWANKRRVCRNFTYEKDEYFDFIYVDARHDFKGVYEDLITWWPKLRKGGIYAGHDYVAQNDGPQQSGQDWTVNYDGTKDDTKTVVKGAVDKFATENCRQITVSYRESN